MNKLPVHLLFFFVLQACASDDPKVTNDMSGTDFGSDLAVADLSDSDLPDFPDDMSVNCMEVPVEDCIQFFGECQTVRLYEWFPDAQCYHAFPSENGFCLPVEQVVDELHHSIVDSDGRCWGMLPALVMEPPGWTQHYIIPCSCIKGEQVTDDCTDSWNFCPE